MTFAISRRNALLAFIVFDLFLVAALAYLYLLRQDLAEFDRLRDLGAAEFAEPLPLPSFTLFDQHGEVVDNSFFTDTWSLVFFGFTQCPDVCPLTMRELALMYADELEPEKIADLQVVLVSVDPQRDTPAAMQAYLEQFDGRFKGLTGGFEQINRLAETLYVVHDRLGEGQDHQSHGELPTDDYLINHSGHISVINPEGQAFAVLRLPHRARDLAAALEILLP